MGGYLNKSAADAQRDPYHTKQPPEYFGRLEGAADMHPDQGGGLSADFMA